MKIGEVIRECVAALSTNKTFRETMVLKGGTALHLSEGIDARLSTDIDFSTPREIKNPARFFTSLEKNLARHFRKLGYQVIDGKHSPKPRLRSAGLPKFWNGWQYQFKLSALANQKVTPRTKTRRALVPLGSVSSKIEIEISEHEYCGSTIEIKVGDETVRVYSSVLLVLEKIRAICQQHPSYLYSQPKNRSRDYYDIFQLVKKHHGHPKFFTELKNHLEPVFAAKEVPLGLLDEIFKEDFLRLQESGFGALADTVGGKLEPFFFYAEQLKWLVGEIRG